MLRKKIFYVVALLNLVLNAILVNGQTHENSKIYKIDSLEKVNAHYLKQDISKLKLLNMLTFSYKKSKPENGIETGEQAIILAQKLNNSLLLAEAYHNKALNHYAKKDYNVAKELFEKALAINKSIKNIYGIATNQFQIGNIYIKNKDQIKSVETFEQAILDYKSISDKEGISNCYLNLGNIYKFFKNTSKAFEFYNKALVIKQQYGDKIGTHSIYKNVGILYYEQGNYTESLINLKNARTIIEEIKDTDALSGILNIIGMVYNQTGDYQNALTYYHKALDLAEQSGKAELTANLYGNIGVLYINISNFPKSLEYSQKALEAERSFGKKEEEARYLATIGMIYSKMENYSTSIDYLKKSLKMMNELSVDKSLISGTLHNLGTVYHDLKNYFEAFEYYQKALHLNEEINHKGYMSSNRLMLGELYVEAPDSDLVKMGIQAAQRFDIALENQIKSLTIAKEIEDINKQMEAYLQLSITYEKNGDYANAYESYKNYIISKDSIESDEILNKIESKTMQYEYEKRETALKYEKQFSEEKFIRSQQELNLRQKDLELSNKQKDLQHLAFLKEKAEKQEKEKQLTLSEKEKQLQLSQLSVLGKEKELQQAELLSQKQEIETKNAQRNLFIGGTILSILLALAIFVGWQKTGRAKRKSDELLLNILPVEVADELKETGGAKAKHFDNVTVLFTDFVNFTNIAETLSPQELVNELHACFKAFDDIIDKHGIEKIKTIGDAYLAVCGLPHADEQHPQKVVQAALEIVAFMQNRHQQFGNKTFEIRIGINSGSVVAGIVGVKKFAYDIWGDTVNTAARMEQNSEAGRINISGSTYELVKDKYSCTHRGKISAKGKGEIDMYFVN